MEGTSLGPFKVYTQTQTQCPKRGLVRSCAGFHPPQSHTRRQRNSNSRRILIGVNCDSGPKRVPKDPSSYQNIEELRRELEIGKGQAPFTLTRTIKWLSDAANNGGAGLAFQAYRWVLGLDQPAGWKKPRDVDLTALARIEAETDPELIRQLQLLLLLPHKATLRLIHRCPKIASMSPGEVMSRLVALKGLFPASNVARMVELVPSAFLLCPVDKTLVRLNETSALLREGLKGANVDAIFESDPTILFEEPASLEVGIQRLHDLWDVDSIALGNSDPDELALAVRALGLNGPPKRC